MTEILKVLIVDDIIGVVQALNKDLTRLGKELNIKLEYTNSFTGDEAINIIKDNFEQNLPFDIFIADQRMKRVQGTDILAVAAEYMPQGYQVLYTGQAQNEEVSEAINTTNIDYFISKKQKSQETILQEFARFLKNHKTNKRRRLPTPIKIDQELKKKAQFKNITILVIEPAEMQGKLLNNIKEYVTPYKSQIIEISSLENAIEATQKTRVDIIVVDIDFYQLKDIQKIKVLSKIKQDFPHILFMAASSELKAEGHTDFLSNLINQVQINRFITKPLKEEQFINYMNMLMVSAIETLKLTNSTKDKSITTSILPEEKAEDNIAKNTTSLPIKKTRVSLASLLMQKSKDKP